MRRVTIMLIPDDTTGAVRQWNAPTSAFKALMVGGLVLATVLGYCVFDYWQLRGIRASYEDAVTENQGLRGEAGILMTNLDEVKRSLRRVQDYTTKLDELTRLRVSSVTSKTGIGPLTEEEYKLARQPRLVKTVSYMPAGLDADKLSFHPVFNRMQAIGEAADKQAFDMQHLLSTLTKQKSLLASIPSVAPVNGWVTSGFGKRVSPFTGEQGFHKGVDLAAPVGTPILAPADGVVVFTGKKDGYGNFLMIAHGYGVVTRYGHTAEILVRPGQRVHRGEQVATVGMTGRTTGPHLHYEVTVDGKVVDPDRFMLDRSGEVADAGVPLDNY